VGLRKRELVGAAVALAAGEPKLLHGFPAALRKLKRLLSNSAMSHGENDCIKEAVWRKKKNLRDDLVLRYALERSLEADQSSGRSRHTRRTLLPGHAAVGQQLGWRSGRQMQPSRAVTGGFFVFVTFKILSE